MATIDTANALIVERRGERAVATSKPAQRASWSNNIATEIVKLHIAPNTKKHAGNELQSYMMKLYSKSIHLVKSAQFAFSHCHWMQPKKLSIVAVVK